MAKELPEQLVEDGRVHGDGVQLEIHGGAASLIRGAAGGLRQKRTCLRRKSHLLLKLFSLFLLSYI